MKEIFVECDVASGPYSSDKWLEWANAGRARGANIEEFDVDRLSVGESKFKKQSET